MGNTPAPMGNTSNGNGILGGIDNRSRVPITPGVNVKVSGVVVGPLSTTPVRQVLCTDPLPIVAMVTNEETMTSLVFLL